MSASDSSATGLICNKVRCRCPPFMSNQPACSIFIISPPPPKLSVGCETSVAPPPPSFLPSLLPSQSCVSWSLFWFTYFSSISPLLPPRHRPPLWMVPPVLLLFELAAPTVDSCGFGVVLFCSFIPFLHSASLNTQVDVRPSRSVCSVEFGAQHWVGTEFTMYILEYGFPCYFTAEQIKLNLHNVKSSYWHICEIFYSLTESCIIKKPLGSWVFNKGCFFKTCMLPSAGKNLLLLQNIISCF